METSTKVETYYYPKVTTEITKEFIDSGLFVRGNAFLDWYRYPEGYFSKGAIFSLLRNSSDELIGIGILNFDASEYVSSFSSHDKADYDTIIGFFIKEEYRNKGFAKILFRDIQNFLVYSLKNEYKKINIICTGLAFDVMKNKLDNLRIILY